MTFDEAHRILSNGLLNAPSEHEWCMAFEMAIKALEQEPVLDKIRAEIEQTRKMYLDMNDIDWLNGCDYVLSVIDKYKAKIGDWGQGQKLKPLFCEECGITETQPMYMQRYCRYCGAEIKEVSE